MSIRKEIERKIERKRAESVELQRQLDANKSFIEGLQEALKLAPPDEGAPEVELRVGSDLDKVRAALRLLGKPTHIDEIIFHMDKTFTGNTKTGLAGSLGSYAKKHKVFTKTAPNTFGLIEFNLPKNVSHLDAVNEWK